VVLLREVVPRVNFDCGDTLSRVPPEAARRRRGGLLVSFRGGIGTALAAGPPPPRDFMPNGFIRSIATVTSR